MSMDVVDALERLDVQGNHVYVIFGDREENEQKIREFLTKSKEIDLHQNPDVFFFNSPQFSIAQSRKIKALVSMTNAKLDRKYITISSDAITVEAQNALLKTIEDPDSPTVFFILLPSGGYVLETIVSRAQIIETKQNDNYDKQAGDFFALSFKDRIDFFDTFYTDGDDKKPKLNKGEASLFLQALEKELAKQVSGGLIDIVVFDDVIEMKQYILDRSANTKQLLEYISLRIPRIK